MSNVPFDLNNVLQQAAGVVTEAEESNNGTYDIKLVYPTEGNLWVKILFNPQAGIVTRKIVRHKTKHGTVPCLGYYGKDCPTCKALDAAHNVTGLDLWEQKATDRGICYAQFIDSNYKYDKPDDKPAMGEKILLMFPKTIFTELNRIINEMGPRVSELVAQNEGFVVKISRWRESNQTKYKAEIDALKGKHRSCNTDEEFNKMLSELSTLHERIMPSAINDNMIKTNMDIAEKLTREYVSPLNPHQGSGGQSLGQMAGTVAQGYNQQLTPPVPQTPAPPQPPQTYTDEAGNGYDLINNQWVLTRPASAPSAPPPPSSPAGYQQTPAPPNTGGSSSAPAGTPNCYGTYKPRENKCVICPHEVQCKGATPAQ